MCMRLTGLGSQYLIAMVDADSDYFDGAADYRCTLPAGIPRANFWSLTVHDNQTRSMLQTPQRFPRAGSQSYPTPATQPTPDGSVDVYFGPEPSAGRETNWIQTTPARDGSSSCASTAPRRGSSTRPGASARSNASPENPRAAWAPPST